jgi:hypothetical protein
MSAKEHKDSAKRKGCQQGLSSEIAVHDVPASPRRLE